MPLAVLAALLAVGPVAQAHDTWFEARAGARAGHWQLELGTGEQFPRQAFTLPAEAVRLQACQRAGAPAWPMQVQGMGPAALALRAATPGGSRRGQSGAVTCWAELQPLDIVIEPSKVPLYLDEINASPELRALWRERQSRGLPWVERYSKHARIELLDRRLGGGDPPAAQPVPMAMDIVLDSGLDALQVGDEIRFRVLRDGRPLAGQAIEARNDLSPIGFWLRTDEQGQARLRLPLPGAWLLRGTDLRPSADRADAWDSRFVTLAFRVNPRSR